jgi:hypothetical protein
MSRRTRYVLNVNEGIDTIHRDPLEQCNNDDAEGRQVIDEQTAIALVEGGTALRCQHCWPEDN